MKLYLIDRNAEMVTAWRKYFDGYDNIEIIEGDFFSQKVNCIVSPANSFGFMDGGLDLVISKRFGWGLQDKVRAEIKRLFNGECLVGQAFIVETGDKEIPYCMVAPTMRVPLYVPETVNAYLAAKAVFLEWKATNEAASMFGSSGIQSLTMSGFCTGVGAMSFDQSARQMKAAYDDFYLGRFKTPQNWVQAKEVHQYLTGWDYNPM